VTKLEDRTLIKMRVNSHPAQWSTVVLQGTEAQPDSGASNPTRRGTTVLSDKEFS